MFWSVVPLPEMSIARLRALDADIFCVRLKVTTRPGGSEQKFKIELTLNGGQISVFIFNLEILTVNPKSILSPYVG